MATPGIDDPLTAVEVVAPFGVALCGLVPRHLPTGAVIDEGRPVLVAQAWTTMASLMRCFI